MVPLEKLKQTFQNNGNSFFVCLKEKYRCNSSQSFSSLETRNQKILFILVPYFFKNRLYIFENSKQSSMLFVYYWYNPGPLLLLLLRWDLMIVSMSVKSKLSAWCDKMNRNCAVKRERERHVLGRFFKAFCVNFEFMGKTPSFLAHY